MEPDHLNMTPPSLRLNKTKQLDNSCTISVWDLRLSQPNVSYLASGALHSMEHFLNVFLVEMCPDIINVAPLGCQTGFYIVAVNLGDFNMLAQALEKSLKKILVAVEVPLANEHQCGRAENHSLRGAQNLARWLLSRREEWSKAVMEVV